MVTKKTPMAINWRRWWCTLMVMHPIRGVFTSSVAPMPIIVQLNLSRGRFTTRNLIFECLQLRNFQQWTNVAPELKFIELQFYMRFLHFLPVLDLKSTKKSIGDGPRALKCSTLPGKVIFCTKEIAKKPNITVESSLLKLRTRTHSKNKLRIVIRCTIGSVTR